MPKIGRPKGEETKLVAGFHLPVKLYAKLEAICKRRGISKRELFKEAVERAR